jgi:heptosyltransferase I
MLRKIDFFFGVAIVLFISFFYKRKVFPANISKIAIFKIRGFGDSIILSGAINNLKKLYPNAEFVFIGDKSTYELSKLLQGIDRSIYFSFKKIFSSLSILRDEKFDLFFDFGAWSRVEAMIAFLSKSKFTIGFSTSYQLRHFLFDGSVNHNSTIHEFNNYLNLSNFGGLAITPSMYSLLAPATSSNTLRFNCDKYVIIHSWAGGSMGKFREWPGTYWSDIFQFLVSKGYYIIIVTGPSDSSRSMSMVKSNSTISNYLITTSNFRLTETISVIKNAEFSICINSGIMHLCAAIGIPTIGLSGPTNISRWGPLGPNSYSVTPRSGDYGYLNHGFEYSGHDLSAMNKIHPSDVIKVIEINGLINVKS